MKITKFFAKAGAIAFASATLASHADGSPPVTALDEFTVLVRDMEPPIRFLAPPGIVAWWPGDSDARDIVGTNNGAFAGGAGNVPAFVGPGFGVNRDGGILVPDSPDFAFGTGDFSVEFWVKFHDLQDGATGIISKDTYTGDPSTVKGWLINVCGGCGDGTYGVGSGGFGFETREVTGFTGPHTHARWDAANLAPDVWYHVAAVRKQSILGLYVDGILRASTPEPQPTDVTSPAILTIGTLNPIQIQPFRGILDEVTVYERALSESEIRAIIAAGAEGKAKAIRFDAYAEFGPLQGGTSGVWRYREYDGAVARDLKFNPAGSHFSGGQPTWEAVDRALPSIFKDSSITDGLAIHPGLPFDGPQPSRHDVGLVWIAPYSGFFSITGFIRGDSRFGIGGDGFEFTVTHGETSIFNQRVLFDDKANHAIFVERVFVAVGESLNFRSFDLGNNQFDSAVLGVTVRLVAEPTRLIIHYDQGIVVLRWKSTFPAYNLEKSDSLGSAWVPEGSRPFAEGEDKVVRIAPQASAAFYRLTQ